jgi:hypothetical protein
MALSRVPQFGGFNQCNMVNIFLPVLNYIPSFNFLSHVEHYLMRLLYVG